MDFSDIIDQIKNLITESKQKDEIIKGLREENKNLRAKVDNKNYKCSFVIVKNELILNIIKAATTWDL